MRIYEGYFNDAENNDEEIVKDIELTTGLNDNIDNPDDYSSELMFEFAFAGSSLTSIKYDEAMSDIKKIMSRIKYYLDESAYVDKVSDYMPVSAPSSTPWKECDFISNDENTHIELRTIDKRRFYMGTSMHYGINVFCDIHFDNVRNIIKFLRMCFAIVSYKGIRDWKHPFIIAVLFNKIDRKDIGNINIRINSETANLFLRKYESVRQANWNLTSKGYSKNILRLVRNILGTGHTLEVLDCLNVSQNQIIIDKVFEGNHFSKRKKRLGIYPLKNKQFNIDKFLEYAFPLCKETVDIFDAIRQEMRWLFKCTFTGNKDELKDYIILNDAHITAYFYRMTDIGSDEVIYIIDKMEKSDTDVLFIMYQTMGRELSKESDYNYLNIADFLTPLVELGANIDKLIKFYPGNEYFHGTNTDVVSENIKELVNNNLK